MYKVAKGDFTLQSKHADVSLVDGELDNFAVYWFDTPTKGKALCVMHTTENYPALCVYVEANWKAKRWINTFKRKGWVEKVF